MAPPLPPETQCNICMQPCNPVTTANCVKCQIVYVYNGCLGIKSCSNLQGKIFWSCKTRSLTVAAAISALDSISVMVKKVECFD